MRKPRRSRWRTSLVLLGGLAVWACSGGEGDPPATRRGGFRVVMVSPAPLAGSATPARLYLNQEITVRFSEPVDRLSITPATIQVVDDRGLRVNGKLSASGHTVTFEPVAPVAPTLADGSFKPGQLYRLLVVGFRADAVRSASGRALRESFGRTFRAARADDPRPLLPTRVSPWGFALDGSSLAMASDSRSLRLFFHGPPMPTTVTPEAFRLYRARPDGHGGTEVEGFRPASARLVALERPFPMSPGWAIDLEVDAPLAPGDVFGVELVADPEHALLDALGNTPRLVTEGEDGKIEFDRDVVGQRLYVKVYQGRRVPLLSESFDANVAFAALQPADLNFEVRDGRVEPEIRLEAGSGELGTFVPRFSTVLEVGRPFDRGDGVLVQTDHASFDFTGIYVPRGVVVRLRGQPDQPVRLRCCGMVKIDGELVLEGTPSGGPLPAEATAGAMSAAAGVLVVAGGDFIVAGQIRCEPGPGEGSGAPMTVLGAGNALITGRIPPRSVLALERGGRVHGTAQGGPVHIELDPMTRQPPPGVSLSAGAISPWLPLPKTRHGDVDIRLRDVTGDLRVEVQFADPDPADPSQPDVRPGSLRAPVELPLTAPVALPPGGFVRFTLRGTVSPGRPLPGLGGIDLL